MCPGYGGRGGLDAPGGGAPAAQMATSFDEAQQVVDRLTGAADVCRDKEELAEVPTRTSRITNIPSI